MALIKNLAELATTPERADALIIAEAGYAAINTDSVLRQKMQLSDTTLRIGDRTYSVANRRVLFVGIGKCAFDAAEAIEQILGDELADGIALGVGSQEEHHFAKVRAYSGTHPLPSEANVAATQHILEFLSGRDKNDLIIFLISGGGSTLLCSPSRAMSCTDESILFSELTAGGATIQDINTVRKHVSNARGGSLAATAYPAEIVALIASDVPGNDVACIASGPTVLDTSTIADAKAILEKYHISATNIAFVETPKDPRYFEHVANMLFITNEDALFAMQQKAIERGYEATIVDDRFTGEARDVGRTIVKKLHDAPAKTVLLYAGESTVTLASSAGRGGRNQEMALAALADIREGELLLPFASDGRDNSDHAGAIADTETAKHWNQHTSTNYLETHRSYDFFTTTSSNALITGYTGSNVSDLIIALKN